MLSGCLRGFGAWKGLGEENGRVIGVRWRILLGEDGVFNITLFLVGIFLIAAGGVDSIYAYGAMFAMVGFASGGNVPVASTV